MFWNLHTIQIEMRNQTKAEKKSLFVSKWVKGSEQKEQQQKTYYITC